MSFADVRSRTTWFVYIALAMLLASVGPAQAAEPESREQDQNLRWRTCYQDVSAETGVHYECAYIRVPLDYDTPRRGSTRIALVRIPAADQQNKIGSLLLNPGGPGGSGVDFALGFGPFVGQVYGPEVAARFDVVGFDPRGIARSSPIRCFATVDDAVLAFPPLPFPLVVEEVELFQAANDYLASNCERRHPRIASHMSTANVARDMDVMRRLLGDDKLNYAGFSYGSYLGVTYANLFPQNVGAVVVDGVLDPIAWANEPGDVPFSTLLRSDHGAQVTLEAFFDLCDAAEPGNCALAPNSRGRYAALAAQLLEAPVELTDPETGETFPVFYQDLIGVTLNTLYNPFSFYDGANLIALLEGSSTPLEMGLAAAELETVAGIHIKRRGERPPYDNFVEGFPAVACTDTRNPSDLDVWFEEGVRADTEYGYFGSIWTWASVPCQNWPFDDADRYAGPFDATTEHPVLVIGSLADPATRYEGAVTVRGLLPNSALVTVGTPGHTSLGTNACAGFLTGQYLLDPEAAPTLDGAFCPNEFNPFDLVASTLPPDEAAMQQLRLAVSDVLGFHPGH